MIFFVVESSFVWLNHIDDAVVEETTLYPQPAYLALIRSHPLTRWRILPSTTKPAQALVESNHSKPTFPYIQSCPAWSCSATNSKLRGRRLSYCNPGSEFPVFLLVGSTFVYRAEQQLIQLSLKNIMFSS